MSGKSVVVRTRCKWASIGNKFHMLTVEGVPFRLRTSENRVRSFVVCRCECGNYTIMQLDNLKKDRPQSCGCYKDPLSVRRCTGAARPDSILSRITKRAAKTGDQHGTLTIIGRPFRLRELGKRYYYAAVCECECGAVDVFSIGRMRSGQTTSCGCKGKHLGQGHLAVVSKNKRFWPGKQYGRFTILGMPFWLNTGDTPKTRVEHVVCQCACGSIGVHRVWSLLLGQSRSCGCYHKEAVAEAGRKRVRHGLSHTRIHQIWTHMLNRCLNPDSRFYYRYGGRGISVCLEWMRFENFFDWARENGYLDGLTIDRKNNDGDYCPENCRWVDWTTQANNTSSNRILKAFGEEKTMAEWSRDPRCVVAYKTLNARVSHYKWDAESAITAELHGKARKKKQRQITLKF